MLQSAGPSPGIMKLAFPFLLAFLCGSTAMAAPAAQGSATARALIEQAERLSGEDPRGALELLARALPLLDPVRDAAPRREALSSRCLWTAILDPVAGGRLAEAELAAPGAAGDPVLRGRLHICRGFAYDQQDHVEEEAREYELAVRDGERSGDRDLLSDALGQRGESRYYLGDLGNALTDLKRSYDLNVALGKESSQRRILNAIANLYADRRVAQYDRALEYYRQLLAANEAAGSTRGVATALFNLGSTLESKGDLKGALDYYRRALEIERQRKDDGEVAFDQRAVGVVLTKQDLPREALPWLNAAVAYFDRAGDAERLAQARLSRAVALRKLSRLAEARADLEAARRRFEATRSERFLEKVQEERGLVFAAAGDWRNAYEAKGAQMLLQQKLSEKLREEHTSRLRVQFDTEKKEQENRALQRENELRGRALADARRIHSLQRMVILLGAGLIAILAYLAVRHILDARRFRRLAMTDELTRLPNRRHILALAGEQVRAARQGGGSFCLVALDVDHFKRINDTYGHDVGDLVLQRVAHACRSALRRDDWIGRTGGEEFLAVLPRTSSAVALEVGTRLRSAVERIDCTDLDPGLKVTASLGVTEWNPEDPSLDAVAKRADDSLYRAKQGGRNRVELSPVPA